MIPLAEPDLTGKEKEYVTDAIASGWVSGGGPYVERFEAMVAKASGREWAVATITGTAALHASLIESRSGPQAALSSMIMDRVDEPGETTGYIRSMSFIAQANTLKACGITPRFTDVDKKWGPDATMVGDVVDCAAKIGSTEFKDDISLCCFSFNGNKTVTTGQGGAITGIGSLDREKRVRHLVNVCKTDHYEYDRAGFNYRMPNLNAAMGCAQMERLPEFREDKRMIMMRYRNAGLTLIPSEWMAIAVVDNRDAAIFSLRESGIDARPFWKPLHLQKPYKDCPRQPLPNTNAIWQKLVCIPCSTNLTQDDQDQVIKCIEYSL